MMMLMGTENILENDFDEQELIEEIPNGLITVIPKIIPTFLHEIILDCLSVDPVKRPDSSKLINNISSLLDKAVSDFDVSKDIFTDYFDSLNSITDFMDEEVKASKVAADKGDVANMVRYSTFRKDGKNCKQNISEAIKYLEMAVKHEPSNKLYINKLKILKAKLNNNGALNLSLKSRFKGNTFTSEEKQIIAANNPQINVTNDINPVQIEFIRLCDDPFFEKKNFNIDDLYNNIQREIGVSKMPDLDREELEKENFIFTKGAEDRLAKLFDYLSVGVPVLLEGPTGTSKTLSAEVVCKLLKKELIRFNLSSETKTRDLVGRYVGDVDSWAGISQHDGPFYTAFKEGKILLLDEINLASPSVLQCIEESLDSGVLSIEIPGRPLVPIKMHPQFRLIATQNPNKGLFAHKRQDLGLKFYSRFQVINFPAFTKNELMMIAEGLAKRFDYKDMNVIHDLVNFHKEWSDNPLIADDAQCFTVREIAATVRALGDKSNVYDTVMTIYGARYPEQLKSELKKVMKKYPSLNTTPDPPCLPDFPYCFKNDSFNHTMKSSIFSLKNGRHIILTGKVGCGKTQMALWISNYYNKEFTDSKETDQFFCICTEDTKVADLVGHQSPAGHAEAGDKLIIWQDGFLTKAIKKGKCAVIESIDEAQATVTERLNGLLDQKYDNQDKYFEIPENPTESKVLIKKSFRILATCDIEKINQISPAFLNRFDIIVLENQINPKIPENKFKELVEILINKYTKESLDTAKLLGRKKIRIKIDKKQNNYQKNSIQPMKSVSGKIIEENEDYDYDYDYEYENEDLTLNIPPSTIRKICAKIGDYRNMSKIAKFCKALTKLYLVFCKNNKIGEDNTIECAVNLLSGDSNYIIPNSIRDCLLSMLHEITESTDDKFFYENSDALKNFMAKLMAYSLIEQPICVSGPTGAGKTSAARSFARMRPCHSVSKPAFQMHSFHSSTKTSQFYGTTTLSDGKINFHEGTLTVALKRGDVFIADEFNLSTQSVMKSLAPALEPSVGNNIFIPGIGQSINISSEFFFIACQNELGTIGRNAIPETIAHRFVNIDYPKPKLGDIQSICLSISKEGYAKSEKNPTSHIEAENIAKYMLGLNEMKNPYIPSWSLRDITKIFRRIKYQHTFFTDYIGITFYHNVLFYTLSAVSSNDIDKVIPKINNLMISAFNLTPSQADEYINCYKADPVIYEYEKNYFVKKNNAGVSVNLILKQMKAKTKSDDISYCYRLKSLWNAVFQVSLSDEREPILLMGNSGFKTFLASLFKYDAQIIALNQETSVAQLLGSSGFFTTSEAKLFYLKNLCHICQKTEFIPELQQKWKDATLNTKDIDSIINFGKERSPASFSYAIEHLAERFLSHCEEDKSCVLANTTLEFRPGLFLNAILQKKSLILKDLSNLPTIVLERFNELFSGKQNITLTEDIHNTFTSENYKELTDFSDSFRVFATCPANSPSKLSEAVLSRFSVVSTPEYQLEEQILVLQSYVNINGLNFDESDIDLLTNFTRDYNAKSKRYMSFPQLIKTIDLTSLLNDKTGIENQKINLGISLFRIIGGLIESPEQKKNLFSLINNCICSSLLSEEFLSINDCPLEPREFDGKNGLFSKMTQLFLPNPYAKNISSVISFTPLFCDLLDILHLGMTLHNPIIFEGPPGQGKHAAINYIANMLNLNVIYIMISQSTKVDDLLGKVTISRKEDGIHVEMLETKLVEVIRAQENVENSSIVVLENINNASPAVLNALVPIFNRYIDSILLPNGETLIKGSFNLIGIFNTQQVSSSKDKLPSALINSSIYHIVRKPDSSEIARIIYALFQSYGFTKSELDRFTDNFFKARSALSKEAKISSKLSLNDISKYILFRNITKEFLDETTILQIIFAYRFHQENMIQLMLKTLNLENMKFRPLFSYNLPSKQLYIRITKESRIGLELPLKQNNIDVSQLQLIDSLTLAQKHCLIFLACSILSKRACVVQGDTASGKSFLIRLMAQLLGAKLNVFQMNSDSSVSMLAGQSILVNELPNRDVIKFQTALNDLIINDQLREFIERNIDINQPKTWKPKMFAELINKIDEILPSVSSSADREILESALRLLRETMSPVNRFDHQESQFIRSIKNGEWVLIDGIESAPSEIAEKIASLCGENPELNLYECGPDFLFSKQIDFPPEKQIHDDFHLFITYNSISVKETQAIDQTFLIKSVSFTLPTIDSTIENTSQFLHGSLVSQSYPTDLSSEISSRFGCVHQVAKKESQSCPDIFAGDIQFTGRTLKFVTKAFLFNKEESLKQSDTIYRPIAFAIRSFYVNSYTDDNKDAFTNKLLTAFKNTPPNELIQGLQTNESNQKERNQLALIDLRNIQLFISKRTSNSHFVFTNFLVNCSLIQISDLTFAQKHIDDTLKMIGEIKDYNPNDLSYTISSKFGTIQAVKEIFDSLILNSVNLKVEHSCLQLKEKELESEDSLEDSLSKFNLLLKLSGNSISNECSILLDSDIRMSILKQIFEVSTKRNKNSILQLLDLMCKYPQTATFIDRIFPYNLFSDNSSKLTEVCYWIPLLVKCIARNIPFQIIHEKKVIQYSPVTDNLFQIYLYFDHINCLMISSGSKIIYGKRQKEAYSTFNESKISTLTNDAKRQRQLRKRSLIFYQSICYALDEKIQPSLKKVSSKSIKSYAAQSQIDYNDGNIRNTKQNKYVTINDFFRKTNSSMIKLAWNLVITLRDDQINYITNIIIPIEAEILRSIHASFKYSKHSKIESIYNFSMWMSHFEETLGYLYLINSGWKLNFEKSEMIELEKVMKELAVEEKYLSSNQNIEIWNHENYTEKLNKTKRHIENLMARSEKEKERQRNKKELEKLQKDLQEKCNSKNSHPLLSELIDLLTKLEPTEDSLILAKKKVRELNKTIENTWYTTRNSTIQWPKIKDDSWLFDEKSTNQREVLDALIEYSQIYQILKQLEVNKDKMKYLLQLNDFPQIENARKRLFNLYISSDSTKFSFNSHDLEITKHSLNAAYLSHLYKINLNLFCEPYTIIKIINDFVQREKITKADYDIINKYANTFPDDFCIVLPEIQPLALVYLFVEKSVNIPNTDYQAGPFLKENTKGAYLSSYLAPLMEQNFASFTECIYYIAVYAIQCLTSEKPPENSTNLKKIIYNITNRYRQNDKDTYSIFAIIYNLIDLSHNTDQFFEGKKGLKENIYKFTFDDILSSDKIILNDWVNNTDFLNKYPSFVFWICQNHQVTSQIKNLLKDYKPDPKKLPFWLHSLRVFSSKSCISFQTKALTDTAQIIKKTVDLYVLEKINNTFQHDNYRWINLLIPHVLPAFSDKNIHIIYTFLQQLCQDDQPNLTSSERSRKKEILESALKQVIDLVFSNQLQNYLSYDLNTKYCSTINFLTNPSDYVKNKINSSLYEECQSFLQTHEVSDIKIFIQNEKHIDSFIKRIKESIDDDEKSYNNIQIATNEDKFKKEKQKLKIQYSQLFDDYKNEVNQLLKNPPTSDFELLDKILLKEKQLKQRKFNFLEESIILTKITLNKSKKVPILVKGNKFTINHNHPLVYLGKLNETDITIDEKNTKKAERLEHYTIYKIDPSNDIEKLVISNISVTPYSFYKPKIYFLSQRVMEPKMYIDTMTSFKKQLNIFHQEFAEKIATNNLSPQVFQYISSLKEKADFLRSIKSVFINTENQKAEKTNVLVTDEIKKHFNQVHLKISNLNGKLMNLHKSWNRDKNGIISKELFRYQYEIPIPKMDENSCLYKEIKPSFPQKKRVLLSLPIISLSPTNELVCCMKKINAIIGPLVPSQYENSNKIEVNIISFVEEKVFCNIAFSKPELFYTLPVFDPYETIKIIVSIPKSESDSPETLNIKGYLNLRTESNKKLKIECIFQIILVPLNIILSCKHFKLCEQDSMFRICCGKMLFENRIKIYVNRKRGNGIKIMKKKTGQLNFVAVVEALDGNEAGEPTLSTNTEAGEILLEMPKPDFKNEFETKRLQCVVKIAFSQTFVSQVLIDCILYPFYIIFEIYDYRALKYTNNIEILWTYKIPQTLHFRIMSPCIPFPIIAWLESYLPDGIKILNIHNFSEKNDIKDKIKLSEDLAFSIDIDFIKENPPEINTGKIYNTPINSTSYTTQTTKSTENKSTYFGLNINTHSKCKTVEYKYKIDITFKKINQDFISRPFNNHIFNIHPSSISGIPIYLYSYSSHQFVKYHSSLALTQFSEPDLPIIAISPFHIIINKSNPMIIEYNNDVFVKNFGSKSIKYLKVDTAGNTFDGLPNPSSNLLPNYPILQSGIDLIVKGISKANTMLNKIALKGPTQQINCPKFTIFGKVDSSDLWFPAFDKYPTINTSFLDYRKENVELARKCLKSGIGEALNCEYQNDLYDSLCNNSNAISHSNFAIFMILFMEPKIIKNAYKFVHYLPSFIKNKSPNLHNCTPPSNAQPDLLIIYSYNFVNEIGRILKERYEELKELNFELSYYIKKDTLATIKEQAFSDLMYFDPKCNFHIDHSSEDREKFEKVKSSEEKNFISSFPPIEEVYDIYLLNENHKPVPKDFSYKLPLYNRPKIPKAPESEINNNDKLIDELPKIVIPNVLTIKSIQEFYFSCTQGSYLLPIYIFSTNIQKKLDNARHYLMTLALIYKELTHYHNNNYSIVCESINSFIHAFISLVHQFKSAGVDFSDLPAEYKEIFEKEYHGYKGSEFIKLPELETPQLRPSQWKTKDGYTSNIVKFANQQTFDNLSFNIDDQYNTQANIITNSNIQNEEEDIRENPTDIIERNPDAITNDDQQATVARVVNTFSDDSFSDDEEEDNTEIPDDPLKPKVSLKINRDKISKLMYGRSLDGLISQFTESDGIERVVARIVHMNKNASLNIKHCSNNLIPHESEWFDTKATTFTIKGIIENCLHIQSRLIEDSVNASIPFSQMAVNLLIDCSSFIIKENKIYNMMLLCAFSYALNALEIPYAISIVADQRFRFVIKHFEEDHSIQALQRVLDCVLVPRYRTNYAETIYHAIEHWKINDDQRNQRAFFFFSDGLDENLVLVQSWKEKILNNPTNSFGFIFTSPKSLSSRNKDILEATWKDFSNGTLKAASLTRVVNILSDMKKIKEILNCFVHILSRPKSMFKSLNDKEDIKPEFPLSCRALNLFDFNHLKVDLLAKIADKGKIFVQKDRSMPLNASSSRLQRLDTAHYQNKTCKIISANVESSIQDEFAQFIHQITSMRKDSFRPYLETIFRPNKASQTVLSSTGTDFDITALVLNLINPVPDPLIYLEEKGGLVRNYGATIVIDSSISCFDILSSPHSLQTIRVLFSALSSIDIPCIDVIVATSGAPIVLCSEMPSLHCLGEKSQLWPALFVCLEEHKTTCDLESAIHAACDLRRMRSLDYTSILFVLTDGKFDEPTKERIKMATISCTQCGINPIGIGIGQYPFGISSIFQQAIYAPNPFDLVLGIASCFGEEIPDELPEIKPIIIMPPEMDSILNNTRDILKNEDSPVFKDLKNYLKEIAPAMDAFSDMYNEEQEVRNEHNELVNPEGVNTEMFVKDLLKGQKILIVMLYDCLLNIQENEHIIPAYLFKPANAGENAFVKKAVEFYGIEIKVVQNYKSAIMELNKETIPGKCDYYATWVLSGWSYEAIPDDGNPHLVLQFIDCLLKYNRNGGAVVMFAEGEPLFFQANLFLERLRLPNGKSTQLRLRGNHPGKQILNGDKSGQLDKPKTFNKNNFEFQKCQRSSLAHNLVTIYEGETISFAPNDRSQYDPFIPFMRDSDNGISALFLPGDQENDTGDIVIDCGYTKLFDGMTTNGTFRYIQNIAGWTAQAEARRTAGIQPKDYRPKAVRWRLDESVRYNGFTPMPEMSDNEDDEEAELSSMKRLFAIDYSGSISGDRLYHSNLEAIFNKYYVYGDHILLWDSHAYPCDYNRIKDIWENREGNGGTCPNVIAQYVADNPSVPREHLILVTDGHVFEGTIDASDQILQANNISFKYVTTYVIGTNGDLSVGCPSARNCESVTIEIRSDTERNEKIGAKKKDFSILDQLDNINTEGAFKTIFERVFRATKVKMMGTKGDETLKTKFENLKKRIERSGSLSPDVDQKLTALIGMASGKIRKVFNDAQITAMAKK
ncbi:hypothetical protein TRFO_27550 [Tritrichomonas foetus]|uniref:AAA+ ATPase domain-containing protein n=1 Tax=Tritrichomonas foetus TaxID=1144522 RepID=A0A1J4K0V0_9EUKA|nr:hypothetical protein TRFO_27550 [Tritrichomonas foetus]|eukprot:OHT04875.1 hypothetical protein TRFO_27550 [Tritrichomonas foetus]